MKDSSMTMWQSAGYNGIKQIMHAMITFFGFGIVATNGMNLTPPMYCCSTSGT